MHWLDNGSEHPHRVAMSVKVHMVDTVKEKAAAAFARAGLAIRIIVSGVGKRLI